MWYRQTFSVAALAAATLLLEGTLTRLLAVAQFYHFAFLVISLALLGFGASGSFLSLILLLKKGVFTAKKDISSEQLLAISGLLFAVSVAIAYGVVNVLPFDSYSIAWDRRQIIYFALYYLILALPFLFSGIGIGGAIALRKGKSHISYAANLFGSGIGVLLAPLALWLAGVPGGMLMSGLVGLLAALPISYQRYKSVSSKPFTRNHKRVQISVVCMLVVGLVLFGFLSVVNLSDNAPLGMVISPYKGLAHAKRYPGSTSVFGRWNAISRVDVLAEAGTRQLPGLSYTYLDIPPEQYGLSLDADALQPITLVEPSNFEAASYLPEAVAFTLRSGARTLVIEPGGGLGILQSLAGGSSEVTAVVDNPLLRRSMVIVDPRLDVYDHPMVRTVYDSARVYMRREQTNFDLIFFPLTDGYRPVTSGAYSLSESYDLTVDAFVGMLDRLGSKGLLVVTRWLQTPPSESLRLVATIVSALENARPMRPADVLLAFRSIQTMTVIVQPDGWTASELELVRSFLEDRRFDLVWAPDVVPEEVNRFNRLPEPSYYEETNDLLHATDRKVYFANYPFAIEPTTDDKPFFFHFFTWGQTPELLATIGHTWQPFGGSGYFLLLALLALVLAFSMGLILAPILLSSLRGSKPVMRGRILWNVFGYFTFLGLAFLFIEIPLIQRSILLLGHPINAFTVVVLSLLTFSSLGSLLAKSAWLPRRLAFGVLIVLALLTPWIILRIADLVLGWPFLLRGLAISISMAPLAIMMGLPFPLGLDWLERREPQLVPWAWAINGCASVVAAVLAAILTLSYGFTVVLLLGAVSYAGAFSVISRQWYKPHGA